MYVEPVGLGSTTDYSWIATIPRVRNAVKKTQINPFSPDGQAPNPLRDIVTLSGQSTRFVRKTSEFSPVFNYLFLMYPNENYFNCFSLSKAKMILIFEVVNFFHANLHTSYRSPGACEVHTYDTDTIDRHYNS